MTTYRITFGQNTFENEHKLKYLGSLITGKNENHILFRKRLENRAYFSNRYFSKC